ncbi:hypothetical protein IGI04_023059 [Brassica rapa subsp. trilocularis]|uniref:Uncharacterized protein n=1 Tax=Brassica rapa subsp. trilocularis TaxID=1813537 RepID=A0ABQ7M6Y0_BRACM|nr:hypothetical protein IGI04_023059 [Brassica rapa subsp. trilocularis]
MPILLKSDQYTSREEAVEEMKDCRSTVHPCHRLTEVHKPHKVTKRPMDDQKAYLCISKPLLMATKASQRGLIFRSEFDTCPTDAISNDINNPKSIDVTTSPSIDNGLVSEQKEFDVFWWKEEEKLEEEEKDQGRFSVIIDSSLPRWCQKIQNA